MKKAHYDILPRDSLTRMRPTEESSVVAVSWMVCDDAWWGWCVMMHGEDGV